MRVAVSLAGLGVAPPAAREAAMTAELVAFAEPAAFELPPPAAAALILHPMMQYRGISTLV